MERPSWDEYFMEIARVVALRVRSADGRALPEKPTVTAAAWNAR